MEAYARTAQRSPQRARCRPRYRRPSRARSSSPARAAARSDDVPCRCARPRVSCAILRRSPRARRRPTRCLDSQRASESPKRVRARVVSSAPERDPHATTRATRHPRARRAHCPRAAARTLRARVKGPRRVSLQHRSHSRSTCVTQLPSEIRWPELLKSLPSSGLISALRASMAAVSAAE